MGQSRSQWRLDLFADRFSAALLIPVVLIYWDQGSALYQLGLLAEGLPVVGAEAAQRLRNPQSVPANRLIARWAESEGKD